MGLKCSVIGHKYGEAEVEREREEQGSEVVITIQERETCERCGKTRIVSENKEVTAIETPSDIAGDMIDDGDSGPAEDPPADTEADEAPSVDDEPTPSEPSDSTPDDETPAETEAAEPTVEGSAVVDDSAVDAVDPDADDAEIIDDEQAAGGDSELEDPSTGVAVAEAEPDATEPPLDAEETAVASDPESDDGMIIDGDDDESTVDDRQPGEWPSEPDDDEDDWAPETGSADDDGESSEVEPFGGTAVTVPEGQFRCPECEFTTDVESSSLRAGDFCPECHMGALVNTAE